MTLPFSLRVQAALDTGPFDPTANFVTLAGVRQYKVAGGRETQFEQFGPRTATVVMDNRSRTLDPLVNPNAKAMRRLRIDVQHNSVWYPRFYGYLDALPQEWRRPRDAFVTLTATDGFKVLEQTDLLSSIKHEYLTDPPVAAYMLDEQSEATAAADLTAEWTPAPLVYGKGPASATYAFGDDPVPGDPEATSLTLSPHLFVDVNTIPDAGWVVQPLARGVGPALSPTNGLAVECAFKTTESRFSVTLFDQHDRRGNTQINLRLYAAGWLEFTSVGDYVNTFNDGEWHHVAGVIEADRRTFRLYVDGVQRASAVASSDYTFPDTPYGSVIGGLFTPSFSGQYLRGSIAAVGLYNHPLSAARIAAHATAVRTGFAGELSGARVSRLLDYAGFPSTLREIDAGSTELMQQPLGKSALAALRQVALSESGALYMTRDGKVRFRARHTVLTGTRHTTVQATFGNQPGELPYANDSLRVDNDDEQIRNDISVTRVGGVTQRAYDAASQDEYGPRRYSPSEELLVASDHEMFDYAHWLLERYSDPHPRIDAIKVHPQRDSAALFPLVLGLDYGDRVAVKYTPPGAGPRIEVEALIEHVSESATPDGWEGTDWRLSAAETRRYPVWKASAAASTTTWKASPAASTDVYVY